jgi:hypothetical protein
VPAGRRRPVLLDGANAPVLVQGSRTRHVGGITMRKVTTRATLIDVDDVQISDATCP